jgi:hypothetical protein
VRAKPININVFLDTSVVILSFVTSYARIFMHEIKFIILLNEGIIYYSDTDSIVTNLNLDKLKLILPKEIGNKLGQLKLEYIVQEAYFISNKTYVLKLEDGQTIKNLKEFIAPLAPLAPPLIVCLFRIMSICVEILNQSYELNLF